MTRPRELNVDRIAARAEKLPPPVRKDIAALVKEISRLRGLVLLYRNAGR